MHDVVLALPLAEVHPRNLLVVGEAVHRRDEPVGDLAQRRGRGDRHPQLALHVADEPRRVLQLGLIHVQYIRSMHSISNITCSVRTSATVRATVMTGSGRIRRPQANHCTGSHTPDRLPGTVSARPTGAPTRQATNRTSRRAGAKPPLVSEASLGPPRWVAGLTSASQRLRHVVASGPTLPSGVARRRRDCPVGAVVRRRVHARYRGGCHVAAGRDRDRGSGTGTWPWISSARIGFI